MEPVEDRLREALLVQCRSDRIEPPGRIDRIVAAARARADRVFCAQTGARPGEVCAGRLLDLVAEGNEDGTALLASLKRDPGAAGPDSLLTEITKLTAVRQLRLPEGLFADCSEKLVAAWRARAIKMYPSDFRDAGEDVRTALPAALCASRQAEATDALVELLLAPVRKVNARAERRAERQLTAELKKVRGKEGILFRLADAAVGSAGGVKVTTRKGGPWITVPKLEPLAEPTGLQALQALKACHAFLDPGDTLVVPSPDRYGRSLQDLINIGRRAARAAASASPRCTRTWTPPPPAAGSSSTSSPPWRSSSGNSSSSDRRGLGRCPRPRPGGGRPSVATEEVIRAARDLVPDPGRSITSIAKLLGVSPGCSTTTSPTSRNSARAQCPASSKPPRSRGTPARSFSPGFPVRQLLTPGNRNEVPWLRSVVAEHPAPLGSAAEG